MYDRFTAAKLLLAGALLAGATALQSCNRHSASPGPNGTAVSLQSVNVQWTKEAAERTAGSGKPYALPQLRVYDARGQLVYDMPTGSRSDTIGRTIDRALKFDQAGPGPTVMQSLADLQTYDGRVASSVIRAQGQPLIFDYWASWCIPCKKLEKSLLAWAALKPAGAVKALRAAGQKTFVIKKDSSGKAHAIEVR